MKLLVTFILGSLSFLGARIALHRWCEPDPDRSLLECIDRSDISGIRSALAWGASKNPVAGSAPLHYAALRGRLSAARELIRDGADVNARDVAGSTPLMCAAMAGHAEVAQLLLDHGAKPNTLNDAGHGPLWYAASGGHIRTVAVLLAGGADPNLEFSGGETALSAAIEEGHDEIAEMLRQAMQVAERQKDENGR